MLDIKWIRAYPQAFDQGLKRRGMEPLSDEILQIDQNHRHILSELQELQAERNKIAKEFGMLKSKGEDTSALSARSDIIKNRIPELEHQEKEVEMCLKEKLTHIPNMLSEECPDGTTELDNIERDRFGTPKTFDFPVKQHFELGEDLGQIDFERATKLSGSRFVVLYREIARLERALANFMLDTHTRDFGYTEASVPLLVRDEAMFGTGQLPKFHDDQFQTIHGDSTHKHWLIPTAEVSLTNLVAQEILKEEELPLRYVAYTPCFRAEAGAAGRDTRGMIRLHQFSKVELVSITTPDQAIQEHERMLMSAQTILQRLNLPYRTLTLCSGDTGFTSEKTYDIEVWLPGQNAYREISSCSRCNTFQARRMNTRYRRRDTNHVDFVHTLNGSGIAVGRALIAVLENYQNADGSITVPEALIPYMGGLTRIAR